MLPAILRRLRRDPLSSAVNILGLAVALATVLLMTLYIRFETSYDRFLTHAERLWRLGSVMELVGQGEWEFPSASPRQIETFGPHRSGIEAVTRAVEDEITVTVGDRRFERRLLFADPNFLTVLDLPLIAGAPPDAALGDPNAFVPTRSFARTLFGDADPLGRTVELADGRIVTVTAVMQDIPPNSHLKVAGIVAEAGRERNFAAEAAHEGGVTFGALFYILLAPGADPDTVLGIANDQAAETGPPPPGTIQIRHRFNRLVDMHLDGIGVRDPTEAGDRGTLVAMALVGALILLVAIVNATNLMTAQALRRGLEVGVRKTLGAGRGRLVRDFLLEALTATAIAMLIALSVFELARPHFSNLVGRELSPALFPAWEVATFVIGFTLLTALLGGAYPALMLARWRPDDVFRGRGGPVGSGTVRAVLVVLQFAATIALIVATVTVLRQVDHARDVTLGGTPETLLTVTFDVPLSRNPGGDGAPDATRVRLMTLRDEMARHPGVVAASLSSVVPTSLSQSVSSFSRLPEGEDLFLSLVSVDPRFFELYGVPLIAGLPLRDMPAASPGNEAPGPGPGDGAGTPGKDGPDPKEGTATKDTPPRQPRPVVLTAEAARKLGHADPAAAIGASLYSGKDPVFTVIGVSDDVVLRSARDATTALMFVVDANVWNELTLRLAPGDARPVLDAVDRLAAEMFPDLKVVTRFMDQRLDELYRSEIRQGRLFALFGGIAIVLSCMGLFALTALAAARRTKEIGIRRVVGARVGDILVLLGWQFTKPVILANLIAWPVAWVLLSRWLEQFAQRVSLDPLHFLLAGLAALAFAVATVSIHAIRVATSPPAAALRSE